MQRFFYTSEHIEFLRENQLTPLAALVDQFNARFGTQKTVSAIHSVFGNHGIKRIRKGPGKGNGKPRLYTPEQMQFIRDNYTGRSVAELTTMFNSTFGTDRTWQQIKTFVHNRGIVSGRTGQFEKGSVSWNKGVKGYMGANATSFKKGDIPPNQQPMWTERIGKDGYIEMKVPERNPHTGHSSRFKHKHLWLWEQANGPLPKGHCVIFVDGDYRNFDLANLMLVTRVVLLHMNLHHYKEAPADLKPSIMALARLEAKAGIRSTGRAPGAGRKKGTRNKS